MTIYAEGEIVGCGEDGFRAKDDDFCFIAVEFEEVVVHPGFDVRETIGEGGEDGWSDGFGGNIELGVVGVTVEI